MKSFLLFISTLGLCLPASSQNCSRLYLFDPSDKKNHSVISRDLTESAIVANGKASAVQTFNLPINWTEKGKSVQLKVQANFDCTDNLEARDFVWVYFRVNGHVSKTITIKGIAGATTIQISDSITVPYGSKVTLRAALVCDSPEESITLRKGDLEVCQIGKASPVQITTNVEEAPVNYEPSMQVKNVGNKVKVLWRSGPNKESNLFRLERTDSNGGWSTAGFAKDDCRGNPICDYIFFDSNPLPTTIGYRIVQVNRSGKETVISEEARPVE
ncbi:MAG: hypothetical protein ACKOGP_01780 [Bacteroidota bacterium]